MKALLKLLFFKYHCDRLTHLALTYTPFSVFMDVFHTAIDTVIMCYIHDSEGNGGHPVYAFQSMTEFLREHGPIKVDEQQPQRAVDGNLHSVI